MSKSKPYRVKVLDFRYEEAFSQLNFRYLYYDITAQNKKEALKLAQEQYMRGEKGVFSEELPFLLKLFTVDGDYSL